MAVSRLFLWRPKSTSPASTKRTKRVSRRAPRTVRAAWGISARVGFSRRAAGGCGLGLACRAGAGGLVTAVGGAEGKVIEVLRAEEAEKALPGAGGGRGSTRQDLRAAPARRGLGDDVLAAVGDVDRCLIGVGEVEVTLQCISALG